MFLFVLYLIFPFYDFTCHQLIKTKLGNSDSTGLDLNVCENTQNSHPLLPVSFVSCKP